MTGPERHGPIGFLGVGTMGRGMVHCLLTAGYDVVCFDVSPTALDRVAADGAAVAESPADVARRARVVLSMLPAADHVEAALIGPGGAVDGAGDNSIFVDASTVDPMTIGRLASRLAPEGIKLVDGAVSGSPRMAWDGAVTLLVGGSHDVIEDLTPVLQSLCAMLIHTGELGTAKVAKLVNNLVGAVSMVLVSEAFAFGLRAGVDARVLHAAMMSSWARCANLESMAPVAALRPDSPPDERFPDFSIDNMIKDLTCVLETARHHGSVTALTSLAQQVYVAASAQGYGGDAIWNVFEAIRSASVSARS
ncbi:MAG: NAD(P)-dependent oxidoreductase [Acidimicrobiales bacterium]